MGELAGQVSSVRHGFMPCATAERVAPGSPYFAAGRISSCQCMNPTFRTPGATAGGFSDRPVGLRTLY